MCYGEKTGDIKIELEQFLCTLNMTRFLSALLHICRGVKGKSVTGKTRNACSISVLLRRNIHRGLFTSAQ